MTDINNIFQVTLPSDYTFNDQSDLQSISYGNIERETYVLSFAERKDVLPATTTQEYFDLVVPGLDNIQIEQLAEGVISNPYDYNVLDHKITGSFAGILLVWYQRIIEQDNYFAQFNSWTLESYHDDNRDELFNNIASFEWKDGANTVTTGTVEDTILSGSEEVVNDETTTGVMTE